MVMRRAKARVRSVMAVRDATALKMHAAGPTGRAARSGTVRRAGIGRSTARIMVMAMQCGPRARLPASTTARHAPIDAMARRTPRAMASIAKAGVRRVVDLRVIGLRVSVPKAAVPTASARIADGRTISGPPAGTAMAGRRRTASVSIMREDVDLAPSIGMAMPPEKGMQTDRTARHIAASPERTRRSPGATGPGVAVFLTVRHAARVGKVVPHASVPRIAGATVATIEAATRAEQTQQEFHEYVDVVA